MTHVETHYRIIVAAGHHRQPRSTSSWIEPTPPSTSEQVQGTPYTPFAPAHLAYTADGGDAALARFVFWSVTDGTNGSTSESQQLHQVVTAAAMTVTAWYVPEGGGGQPPGPPFMFVDAFSDAIGDFVDDTFVTVTSDPSLTHDANVVGEVPTTVAETLHAAPSIHTGEGFEHWIGGTSSDADDSVPAGYGGIAIATYQRGPVVIPKVPVDKQEGVIILWGIVNDAPGAVLGPNGPVPVDPGWGSYLQRVAQAAAVGSMGAKMRGGSAVTKVALAEVASATKALTAEVGKRAASAKEVG
jgi:hypothetical protein